MARWKAIHRLVVKLSEKSYKIPPQLFLRGVHVNGGNDPYSAGGYIGGGGFADVYRGSFQGKEVAVKRLRVFSPEAMAPADRSATKRRFGREVNLWYSMKHDNVLPFIGVDVERFAPSMAMVSPWMANGTLLSYLTSTSPSSTEVIRLLYESAQGLAFVHSWNVVHGDLRGSNILIDDGYHARIADFGLAVFADASIQTHTKSDDGTQRWMAPELLAPDVCGYTRFQRTTMTDVYAFGCVCLEVWNQEPPFSELETTDFFVAMLTKTIKINRPTLMAMDNNLWSLVRRCLSFQADQRPDMADVVAYMVAEVGVS
ncbi:hypothetical protein JAAARDRAFT_132976 [Jaapia argillacea MUCL 33604]|uniref:Protein kinase domain-containing protein n=1 Tax=Jaapia argillacea MUCL 33604 TaxID=933084 RepID=A0A067PMM9_9AGAM|nr:hypothetical protein JAAARDRAFT_132976 [Jaapia argillacea MUCL 33604]